jgi:CheY-like chemotaxis protein
MGTKLLIVDDEPFTVDMLQTFLTINGYDTVGAFSGEDGLLMVKVEHPEVVILDLMLPDIEGYEVCQRIRQYPPTASLPVLVLSARAEPESKSKAMAHGADAYMVKPVQFPMLLSELTRIMEEKKSAPAPTMDAPATPAPVNDLEIKPATPSAPVVPAPAQPIPPSSNGSSPTSTTISSTPAPTNGSAPTLPAPTVPPAPSASASDADTKPKPPSPPLQPPTPPQSPSQPPAPNTADKASDDDTKPKKPSA